LKARSTKALLARKYGVPISTITSWLRTARAYGFLEATSVGKRGGPATELAREVAGDRPTGL
jgi:transposase-like protein